MTLPAGTRLGVYEILSKLGEGGMGEVYRARDTTLGRDVAIKVLPGAVASDADRLARFAREAKLLASLSHANIAQVYGLEQRPSTGSGPAALVMELAPGEDLTVHLLRGAMSVHDALPIAIQIAFALEAAHERGIIHRDLKPANIKVTADGAVKVLDFGLAKALDPASTSGSIEAMNSPTLTAQATAAGIILGTAAYMSPEQARGRDADKRADVWAFGVVLFEMLTGTRLFQGETISDTLAAVLRQDIPWSALPAGTPAEIVRLLRRCLERDRKQRLHDVADARIVLEEVVRGVTTDVVSAAAPLPPVRRAWWPLAAGAIALLALGVAVGRAMSPPAVATIGHSIRLVLPRPPGVTEMEDPAVAPDGRFVVYVGASGSKSRRLYMQRLDEIAPRPIERTEGATMPVVSPDNRWIAYQRSKRLEKVSVDGGDPIFLTDLPRDGGPGMAWLTNNRIAFASSWLTGLSSIGPDGGATRAISTLDAAHDEIGHWFPSPLPDGRHALITIWRKGTGLSDAEVAVLDLETGTHTILCAGAEGRYLAPGFLTFFRAGAFHAVRFDANSRTISGNPVRVLDDAFGNSPEGDNTQAGLAPTGTFAYLSGPARLTRELAWIAEGGKVDVLPYPARPYRDANISADGKRLVISAIEGARYVMRVLGLDRPSDDALDLPGSNWAPVWHPDGRQIAFTSMRKGEFDVYSMDVTAQAATPLLVTPADEISTSFMPDGSALIVQQSEPDGRYIQKRVPFNPIGPPMVLIPFAADRSVVSRDGRFVVFCSGRSGTDEIYVQAIGGGQADKISSAGGTVVAWAPNGREILYLREPEIIAVPFTVEGGRLRTGAERVWSRVPGNYNTDVLGMAPDGRALVLIDRQNTSRELRVVVNWQHDVASKMR